MKKKAEYTKEEIGAKAYVLRELEGLSLPIPPWMVLPVGEGEDYAEKKKEEFMKILGEQFTKEDLLAVRSSGVFEDSAESSFAGQYDTFLNVKIEEAPQYVKKCLNSVNNERVRAYVSQGKDRALAVILQKMIPAERAGVMFTANPSGLLNEMVIVCGEGLGENVVENRVDVTTYFFNTTDRNFYFEQQGEAAVLSREEVEQLVNFGEIIKEHFGCPQDIEWCIADGNIYILQARPITTLSKDEKIYVLDNSNIVESYPGTTLPLSVSFVKEAYYRIFENVLKRLTSRDRIVYSYKNVLQNMVDAVNGRIYYRISNWYGVLCFLPFSSKIIPIWQDMLGVSERKVTLETEEKVRFFTRVKVTFNTVGLLITVPRKMQELNAYFLQVRDDFNQHSTETMTNAELIKVFWNLAESLIAKWDITLANDMYAFIYTGLLKQQLKKRGLDEVKGNSYISNIANLESMRPVRELVRLALFAKECNAYDELSKIKSRADFENFINVTEKKELALRILAYLEDFGDRNLEELKMESPTFRTDPELFMGKLTEYMLDENMKNVLEEREPEEGLEKEGWWIRFLAKRAAVGIKNRELSRLNRARVYGMIRGLFLHMGINLHRDGLIEDERDIFYLELQEIQDAAAGHKFPLKELVAERKLRYEEFDRLPAYSRLIFQGEITQKGVGNVVVGDRSENVMQAQGTPCSYGKVTGEILVLEKARYDVDVSDKILVAKMTDPGWVFLIARAKGIISEKGSLLSHTAIIARELKKPTVVGVKNAVTIFKDGDIVEMDGATGSIVVKERKNRV